MSGQLLPARTENSGTTLQRFVHLILKPPLRQPLPVQYLVKGEVTRT